jgi:ribonuclease P protein subunit POP4
MARATSNTTPKSISKAQKTPTTTSKALKQLPIAHSLLARAHSPETASTIHTENIKRRPLFLHPTNKDDLPTDTRAARQRARAAKELKKKRMIRRPKPLSAAQKRKLGLYDVPHNQRKWEIFVGLNTLWQGYIRDVLGWTGKSELTMVDPKAVGPLIASADLHGAEVEVVQCRCVGRVGIRGIIVKDTRETVEVITRQNELKVIPKEYTVFRLEIPLEDIGHTSDTNYGSPKPFVAFELQGSQFAHRPAERATRKLKLHLPPDI